MVVKRFTFAISHLLMSFCLNIVSLTHCIICVLYESSFVNDESTNIGLKLMRFSFHSFIHSFIHSFNCFIAILCSCGMLKGSIGDCWNNVWCFVIFWKPSRVMWRFTSARRLYFARRLPVCFFLFVRKITQKLLLQFWWNFACRLPTLQKLICDNHKNFCDHNTIIILWLFTYTKIFVTVTK